MPFDAHATRPCGIVVLLAECDILCILQKHTATYNAIVDENVDDSGRSH
jgi:hypothetical protein